MDSNHRSRHWVKQRVPTNPSSQIPPPEPLARRGIPDDMIPQPTDQSVLDIMLRAAVAAAVDLDVDVDPGMIQIVVGFLDLDLVMSLIAVATVTSEMSEVIVQLVAAAVDLPLDETEIVTAA